MADQQIFFKENVETVTLQPGVCRFLSKSQYEEQTPSRKRRLRVCEDDLDRMAA